MKRAMFIILSFASLTVVGQNSNDEFDAKNWQPPYALATPSGWDVERFQIPIEFAPQILYKGVEDIRFTPGWGNPKSDEYWTYAFLWYLDGLPEMNEITVGENLKAYYTGLVGRNIEPRKIPTEKVIPTKTHIKEMKAEGKDSKTYEGTIEMLDYMEQKPITLNCIIHFRPDEKNNKTFVFYELSPKPLTDNIWLSLNKLWLDFDSK